MRQLLGLGLLAVGAIAVFAAVTGNYKPAIAALGLGGDSRRDPTVTTTTASTVAVPHLPGVTKL